MGYSDDEPTVRKRRSLHHKCEAGRRPGDVRGRGSLQTRRIRLVTTRLIIALCLALPMTAVGCGSDDQSPSGNGHTADVGEATSQALTASAGGSVMLDSGAAGVDIPAAALPADATVTVDVIDPGAAPERERLASSVFEFGPDGTVFNQPVSLSLRIDRSAVPAGAELSVSWLNEQDRWEPLPGATVSGDMITAQTTHFSVFAVTFEIVDGNLTQTGGMCEANSFSACGGDPTGTWTIGDSCLNADFAQIMAGGGGEQCEGLSVSADIDYVGSITISGDGTYATDMDVSIVSSARFPKSCLGGVSDCSNLGPEASDAGDACVIESSENDATRESGTWESRGTTLYLESPGDGPSNAEYCVRGNRLEIFIDEGEGAQIKMVLTR